MFKLKKRKSYNPYLLPPWLRKTRFYLKGIVLPIAVFQGIRVIILPTTGDILVLIILILLYYLFSKDII